MAVTAFIVAAGAWFFAAFFALLAVGMLIGDGGVAAALFGLALVLMTAPPSHRWILSKLPVRVPAAAQVTVYVLLIGMMLWLATARQGEAIEAKRVKTEAALRERQANEKATALVAYTAQKKAIFDEIDAKAAAGDFKGAGAIITWHSRLVDDIDLAKARVRVDAAHARDQLKDEANLPLSQRAKLYKKVLAADENDQAMLARARKVDEEILREVQRGRREAELAKRDKTLRDQFSPWDGSHRGVELAIKESMHNPASYEHVETRYKDNGPGKGMTIYSTVRGSNAYGGIVKAAYRAEVSDAGAVLNLKSVN